MAESTTILETESEEESDVESNGEAGGEEVQYTRYPSTAIGSSLAVNDRTLDVQVKSDRPSTP